ncbi:tubulointerstitial nephritis antigen-like [Tachyglossus aculeatus]|uniref:tubulointerstitial nephritis antigen-like n=1 Tax=Tachyglossus aculeatus TaxID=9261 RepID=UPI0018F59D69|nr:tubulointerstitial nephritis antigen-like [Tachyglossus aculeatus]
MPLFLLSFPWSRLPFCLYGLLLRPGRGLGGLGARRNEIISGALLPSAVCLSYRERSRLEGRIKGGGGGRSRYLKEGPPCALSRASEATGRRGSLTGERPDTRPVPGLELPSAAPQKLVPLNQPRMRTSMNPDPSLRTPPSLLLLLLLTTQGALAVRGGRTRRELAPALHVRGIRDVGGSYCQRHGRCCYDRDDDCAVPYMGTMCYCDIFCNREVPDCCPDYWDYCQGGGKRPPPHPGCQHEGRMYHPSEMYKENCNHCTCREDNFWDCEQEPCLVNTELINAINGGNYGWRAGNHSSFWGMTLEEGIRHRLGTIRPSPTVMNMNKMHMNMGPNVVLPRSFDAAQKWPGLIHEPLDQGNCAGSWAFSTAAVASDRISIHSMGHMTPLLSPQNLLSCNTRNQQGCNGGRLDRAWSFLRRRGLVSNNCYPLANQNTIAEPCLMYSRPMGRGKRQATAPCPNSFSQSNHIYQSTPPYRLSSNEKEIMKEIMENGPVQALMEVHEDFFLYKNGVYHHTPASNGKPPQFRRRGTHSVKITGWGEELQPNGQKVKFWRAANSWGPAWGEGGSFRILRGCNECDIESFVVGVWGRVGSEDINHRRYYSRK